MDKFVGSYFHGSVEHQWQGQVLGSLNESGIYWHVQTFSWLDGSNSTRHIVSAHSMTDFTFYPDADSMRDNAENVRARWDKEAEEQRLEGEKYELERQERLARAGS